jgi:galactose mutarotase-like enzyme
MYRTGILGGHAAVWLENEHLQVSILPGKGADVYELIHRPTGVDCLYKTVPGLMRPGDRPPVEMIENYEGGWQELFPNTGDACEYRGVTLPVHGEVALLPWEFDVLCDDETETTVRFWVRTRQTPFRLERRMGLRPGHATLEIEEIVTNLALVEVDFVWGHHIVLGGSFLEAGCQYRTAARTIIVPDRPKEAARARLAPGQRAAWPLARSRTPGETIDLSSIPGPEIRSHDEIYLTDLEAGEASVYNPRLGLTFRLSWDAAIFGCLVMWQPFGGLDLAPWAGSYGVGIEPWTACANLAEALAQGKALRLGPGESLSTTLKVAVIAGAEGRVEPP